MASKKIEVDEFSCERCDYSWLVRPGEKPAARCPKCKSPYWNSPRKLASGPKKKKGITIRSKATAPPASKKPARKKAVVKVETPAAPAPAEPTAVHREVSRHCKADAHAGCKAPDCGCSCHK